MPNGETQKPNVVSKMNLRIASLLKEASTDEIAEILTGPEASLLRMSQQQQQQQQQQRRQAAL
jgi:hypothetical protein